MEGLEPAHLSALDPKSSVSTNFTTSAIPDKAIRLICYGLFQSTFLKKVDKGSDNFFLCKSIQGFILREE